MGNLKSQQRKEQQELAKLRKRNRKRPAPVKTDNRDYTVRTFRFVIPQPITVEARRLAYRALMNAEVLPTYAKAFRYHDRRQDVCMRASFSLELPFALGQDVLRELAPAWQMGKLTQ